MKKILATLFVIFIYVVSPTGAQNGNKESLQLFLLKEKLPVRDYVALRHMEASNEGTGKTGAFDVLSTFSSGTLTFEITKEVGSAIVRNNLKKILENEKGRLKRNDSFDQGNYLFGEPESLGDLLKVPIVARRKAEHLLDGFIFLRPDGELVHSEGRLVKNPSFWTTETSLSVTYDLYFGVRLPVLVVSVAKLRIVGESQMTTTYRYLRVNGQIVENSTR